MYYYVLPFSGHLLKGRANSMNHLLVLFTHFAEKHDLSYEEAIAVWFYGSYNSTASHDPLPTWAGINTREELKKFAESAYKKLSNIVGETPINISAS